MFEAVSPEGYEILRKLEGEATRLGFKILEAYFSYGIPYLIVDPPENQKEAFKKLIEALRPYNIMPILRRGPKGLVLRAFFFEPRKAKSNLIPLALFLATFATIFATGWLLSDAYGLPQGPVVGAFMFVGAMMAVLATHELGHWIAARIHGVSVTPPHFIPAPPFITIFGTFGAFIQQRTPAPNKDALFDIGVAGPVAGFVASLAITLIGLPLSRIEVGPAEGIRLPYILAYAMMIRLTLSPPREAFIILHPVAFAGWVGMLVTMLNLIPAGSLDGGHIARCVFKAKDHMVLGVITSLFIAILSFLFYGGWYLPMAMLALLMAMLYRHPGPLDDVSELAPWRKAALLVPVLIFLLCILPIELPP